MKLRLYVFGTSDLSSKAISQARQIASFIDGAELEIVDVSATPDIAEADHVLTTPQLRRTQPEPERRVVGDMADVEEVARYLSREAF